MNNIKLVVFDMAGTTVNENNMVYKTVQKVINDLGFNVSLEDVLEHGAGKEKHQAITDVLTSCTQADHIDKLADKAFENFKPQLDKAYETCEIKSFEGMEAFFEKSRKTGIKVVLNTGYDRKTAKKLLTKLDWKTGREIDALITADDVQNGRPHPEMIEKAMEKFGITDPAHVLKAGDSTIDIKEGKNANCGVTIGVLSGAQSRKQLEAAVPDFILDKLTDLEKMLFNE